MADEQTKPLSPLAQRILRDFMQAHMKSVQEIAQLILNDAKLDPKEWGLDFERGVFIQVPKA